MTENKLSLEDQIAAGATAPLYMLTGEDDTEKLDLVNSFTKMIDEELHAFNIDRFFGSEIKVDQLVDAGIDGIVNFAPVTINLPDHVSHVGVDLASELEQITFAVAKRLQAQDNS